MVLSVFEIMIKYLDFFHLTLDKTFFLSSLRSCFSNDICESELLDLKEHCYCSRFEINNNDGNLLECYKNFRIINYILNNSCSSQESKSAFSVTFEIEEFSKYLLAKTLANTKMLNNKKLMLLTKCIREAFDDTENYVVPSDCYDAPDEYVDVLLPISGQQLPLEDPLEDPLEARMCE